MDPVSSSNLELHSYLAAHPDTAYVDALFVDLCGIVRGKRYPRPDLDKLFGGGFPIPYSIYLLDVTGGSSDPCGRGFADGDPDGIALPLPGRLQPVPWASTPSAQILMTLNQLEGGPCPIEPRNVACAVLEQFSELGLTVQIAFELEFYLLDPQPDSAGRARPPLSPVTGRRASATQVYGIDDLDEFGGFFRALDLAAADQGIPASVATSEYACGQYEVNLRHVTDPIAGADHAALLRHLVKSLAHAHGMRATFMSKPYAEQTGNGMHLHVSLLDARGENVFDDGGESGSQMMRYAIGGLLQGMYDAMAIFAPSHNACRRFGPNLFVPVNRSWAYNNRSSAIRIPVGSGASRRLEHRVAGADANPYLVLAAALASMHRGITGQVDPGPVWEGNVCETVDPEMPLDFGDALERFRNSAVLEQYLGREYLELYYAVKREEWREFHAEISPRELDWYL